MRVAAFAVLLATTIAAEVRADRAPPDVLDDPSATRTARREAARALADDATDDESRRWTLGHLVVDDDRAVRATLAGALVARGVVTSRQARAIPSRAGLARLLRRLRRIRSATLPVTVDDCAVVGGVGARVVLRCVADRCRSGCLHDTQEVELVLGRRDEVRDVKLRSSDDGACGCCMEAW